MDASIEKVSIIVSKGSLEGIYPALIMANGARAEGIEANLFFTFFGLDAVSKKRHEHIKMATVGQPRPAPRHPGRGPTRDARADDRLPGTQDGKARHPADPRIHRDDRGHRAGLYGCQASCDLFGITQDDLVEQVKDIITVGEFYALATGGQIIFT